jgi:DNA-binding transcriptional LysR family regulator
VDFHQLCYFCAAADMGSFTRAAQKVRATQPTLSQQISKLEKELGTNLFDRLGRAVHLTEAGKTLPPFAKSILNLPGSRGQKRQAPGFSACM